MAKKTKICFAVLLFLLVIISVAGCSIMQKKDKDKGAEFARGAEGLMIEFVQNYPGDRYAVGNTDEPISVVIDVRNKGTYGQEAPGATTGGFVGGKLFLSGFDDKIITFTTSKDLSTLFLSAVSSVNPLGGLDTAEFNGNIIANRVTVDSYEPTILATLCYPYATKASPTVCIDPFPFDDRQQKVCKVGSQTLSSQGAPIAITKIDQEAATNNIKFKITIKNVGKGDVLKPGVDENNANILDKCSLSADVAGKKPALGRKDFDKIKLEKVKIGEVDLFKTKKCGPFADGIEGVIRLFNGEGFIICSLDLNAEGLEGIQSAYTTPLNIELSYGYRSTISKPIKITKFDGIGPSPSRERTPITECGDGKSEGKEKCDWGKASSSAKFNGGNGGGWSSQPTETVKCPDGSSVEGKQRCKSDCSGYEYDLSNCKEAKLSPTPTPAPIPVPGAPTPTPTPTLAPTQIPTGPCKITSAKIIPNCKDGNNCKTGEFIAMEAEVSGDCKTNAEYFYIKAISADGSCRIEYTLGNNIKGIYTNDFKQDGAKVTGSWKIPVIPAECLNKVVSALYASILSQEPNIDEKGLIAKATSDKISGSFTFSGGCGNGKLESALEECDGALSTYKDAMNNDDFSCIKRYNYASGEMKCNDNCKFDTTDCVLQCPSCDKACVITCDSTSKEKWTNYTAATKADGTTKILLEGRFIERTNDAEYFKFKLDKKQDVWIEAVPRDRYNIYKPGTDSGCKDLTTELNPYTSSVEHGTYYYTKVIRKGGENINYNLAFYCKDTYPPGITVLSVDGKKPDGVVQTSNPNPLVVIETDEDIGAYEKAKDCYISLEDKSYSDMKADTKSGKTNICAKGAYPLEKRRECKSPTLSDKGVIKELFIACEDIAGNGNTAGDNKGIVIKFI